MFESHLAIMLNAPVERKLKWIKLKLHAFVMNCTLLNKLTSSGIQSHIHPALHHVPQAYCLTISGKQFPLSSGVKQIIVVFGIRGQLQNAAHSF